MRLISHVLLLSVALVAVAHAEITDKSTGKRYRSREEDELPCKRLWRGYEYIGRLQYLAENPSMCDANNDGDVTIPTDGIHVALLIRGGECSLREKAERAVALPNGNSVQYLIVGSGRHASLENDEEEELNQQATKGIWSAVKQHLPHFVINSISMLHRDGDDQIPVYILHVSDRTLEELLVHVVGTQTEEDRAMGGPRIDLDSRGQSLVDDTDALWISVVALIMACFCSIMLIANGNRHEHQPHAEPQQRPSRRRLMREQVRESFPRYRYHSETHSLMRIVEDWENPEVVDEEVVPELPKPEDMDCCSICLDDFETGDKLRILPCGHVFRARCIGKWLTERSATCPLCKLEILEEEEEEEEEEEAEEPQVEETVPVEPRGWWSALRRIAGSRDTLAAVEETADDEAPATGEGTRSTTGESTEVTFATTENNAAVVEEEYPRQSWWRRMFPSRSPSVEPSAVELLTEPLLSQEGGPDVAGGHAEEVPALEATDPSPRQMPV